MLFLCTADVVESDEVQDGDGVCFFLFVFFILNSCSCMEDCGSDLIP